MGQWILRVILPNGQCCGNVSVISNTVIMIVIRYWKNTFNFRITKQLVKDYGKNSNTVGKCCSNRETSGKFGRPFRWFSESFHGHRWKWHSYNPKISGSLQIFVLWGLAGMLEALTWETPTKTCKALTSWSSFGWIVLLLLFCNLMINVI